MRLLRRTFATPLCIPLLLGCAAPAAPAASVIPPGPAATASPISVPTPGIASFDSRSPGELEAGTYALDAFAPLRILFAVPDGWSKLSFPTAIWDDRSENNLMFATVDNLYRDPCQPGLGFRDPPIGPTVDDLVAALTTVPGLRNYHSLETTLGGVPAQEIDLVAVAEWDACAGEPLLMRVNGTIDVPPPTPDLPRVAWVVDVAGVRLLVATRHGRNLPADRGTELGAIVDSIRFES